LHALAADVAEDDEGGTRGKEGDLEEVAAEFLRGQVDAGDGLSGDEGRVSGMRICWTVRAASRSAAARCSSRVTRTKRQRTTARMAMRRMKVARLTGSLMVTQIRCANLSTNGLTRRSVTMTWLRRLDIDSSLVGGVLSSNNDEHHLKQSARRG
jgi:hypothetical protein